MNRLLTCVLCLCLLALAVATAPAADCWGELSKYKLGESRKPLREIEGIVAASLNDAAKRADIAGKLAACLGSDASIEAKDFACHQLALCATPAQIPALAKLLPDEKLSHLGRFVLEILADPAAGTALREALPQVKGRLQVGIVTSLGARRDAESIPALAPLLAGTDAEIASAAAHALARIGTLDAAKALIPQAQCSNPLIKAAVLDALIECAENLARSGKKAEAGEMIYLPLTNAAFPARIRVAAIGGLTSALPDKGLPAVLAAITDKDAAIASPAWGLLRGAAAPGATRAMIDALPALPAPARAMMLDVLAGRGDVAARPAVVTALDSSDPAVKSAAIAALGALGNVQDIPTLAAMLVKGDSNLATARAALARLRDAAADKAIADLIVSSTNADQRIELIGILGNRLAVTTAPLLGKLAVDDANEKIRAAAIVALGEIVEEKSAPGLVALLIAGKTDSDRDAAIKAIGTTAARMKDRDPLAGAVADAITKADPAAKAALLTSLSRVGGDKALATLRAAVKDPEAAVRDAAVRALAQGSDVAAVPDLLALVKGEDAKHRVLALRGLASLVQKLPANATGDAVKICQQMLDASARTEDKRVALSALGSLKSSAALSLAVKLLADEPLRDEAASAIINIARQLGGNKEPAKSALQKVIDSGTGDAIKKRAKDVQTKGK